MKQLLSFKNGLKIKFNKINLKFLMMPNLIYHKLKCWKNKYCKVIKIKLKLNVLFIITLYIINFKNRSHK
jgi:hypothetical protein